MNELGLLDNLIREEAEKELEREYKEIVRLMDRSKLFRRLMVTIPDDAKKKLNERVRLSGPVTDYEIPLAKMNSPFSLFNDSPDGNDYLKAMTNYEKIRNELIEEYSGKIAKQMYERMKREGGLK